MIETVNGHLAYQQNQIGKVGNAKLPILVHDADWFICHFRQLYFKADGLEIHFLSTSVFTLAENTSL